MASEPNDDEKIRAAILEGKLNPLHVYGDNLQLLVYLMNRDANLRAGIEVSVDCF